MATNTRIHRGKDWAPALFECLPYPPEGLSSWMERHTQVLKSDTYSKVSLLKVNGQVCYLKLYIAKSPLQRIGFRLGFGRGISGFDAAAALLLQSLQVPQPRTCLLVPEGILLLTQGIEDSRNLRELWLARPTEQLAAQTMQRAGELLSALHSAGFSHGDCKWSNLLWHNGAFYLVDLEDVRRDRAAGTRARPLHARQLKDLARFTADAEALGVSADFYETFLDSYCVARGALRDELVIGIKPLLEFIRARHQKKYGHRHKPLLK